MADAPVQYELPGSPHSLDDAGGQSGATTPRCSVAFQEGTADFYEKNKLGSPDQALQDLDHSLDDGVKDDHNEPFVDSEGEDERSVSPKVKSLRFDDRQVTSTLLNDDDGFDDCDDDPYEDQAQLGHQFSAEYTKPRGRQSTLEDSSYQLNRGFASARTMKRAGLGSGVFGEQSTRSVENEEEQKLRNVFQLFDFDDSDSILADDLPFVLKSLGLMISFSDMQAMQKAMDPGGTGEIDVETFVRVVKHSAQDAMSSGEQWKAFRLFDQKHNGYVSEKDLVQVAIDDCTGILSEDQCKFIIDRLSKDPNRGISFEDWKDSFAGMKGNLGALKGT